MELNKIHNHDVMKTPWPISDNSVNCIVTSPPYWGLRDYGVPGQLGLENIPEEFISNLVTVFEEGKRVLKDDGTLWIVIGDSYSHNGAAYGNDKSTLTGRKHGEEMGKARRFVKKGNGLKPKDLVGIPWMLAFALRSAGWYLRQDIIWNKPNPMPESVTDRCTKAHEYIFLLSKSQKYYFDQEAIRVPLKDQSIARLAQNIEQQNGSNRVPGKTNGTMKAVHRQWSQGKDWEIKMAGSGAINSPGRSGYFDAEGNLLVRPTANRKSVWTITTQPFKEAHFATFPQELARTCILAGCPHGGVVLDPFMGAGTTALVAANNGRNYIGLELNPDYIDISEKRLRKSLGLFF